MFDREALNITENTILAESYGREVRFGNQVTRVKNDAALKGQGQSGALLEAMSDVCAEEAEARADRIWRVMHRAIVATGVTFSPELASELISAFDGIFLRYASAAIERQFEEVLKNLGIPDATFARTPFSDRVFGARQMVRAEIELFARSLERKPEFERGASSSVFNIYGPVGALQTGPGSSASVVQNLDGATRSQLIEALGQLAEQVAKAATLDSWRVDEIQTALDETRAELGKPRPGQTMLMAKLQVVANLVSSATQIAPALKSGYEALRSLLAAHGFVLP